MFYELISQSNFLIDMFLLAWHMFVKKIKKNMIACFNGLQYCGDNVREIIQIKDSNTQTNQYIALPV